MKLPQTLLAQYVENRRKDLSSLRRALAAQDLELCADLGHRLKGSGPAYGFPELGLLGIALQEAAQDKQWPEVAAQVDRLEAWIKDRV